MEKIYLDSNATTKTHPDVLKEMLPFFDEIYGNPSSAHVFGREAKKHLEKARERVAALIKAAPGEIVFTSGGTESNNLAIIGACRAMRGKGRHIITSSVEHAAVLNTCGSLEAEGFSVTYVGTDKFGMIDLDELKRNIRKDTVLITVMAANNEVGTIMPFREIGKLAAENGVIFHTDAVQAAGKIPFSVLECDASLVSIASHKINGPKGAGALYVRKGVNLSPCIFGGHQEKDLRAGTENVPAVVGFGKACEMSLKTGIESYGRVKKLRDELEGRILSEIKGAVLNGHPQKRLPNTLNVSFGDIEGDSVVLSLDMEGIAVSTGSACASGSAEISHVLKSMGVTHSAAKGSVRFSLGVFNTDNEINYVMGKLQLVVGRIREAASK